MAMSEYEPEEQELRAQLGSAIHPSLALLRACEQEVLPSEMQLAVRRHLDGCALCTGLLADLATLPDPEPTPAQIARMDARRAAPAARRNTLFPKLIALAAAILLGTGIYMYHRERTRPMGVVDYIRPEPAAMATLDIPLMPLAPPAADSSTLLMRGSHTGPTIAELMPAFRAYNAGDYAAAAKLLKPLSGTYPGSRIVLLYLGVSELFLQRNTEAAGYLTRARGLSRKLDPDAAWYLAIADEHTDPAQSYKLLEALCDGPKSAYSDESCKLRDRR